MILLISGSSKSQDLSIGRQRRSFPLFQVAWASWVIRTVCVLGASSTAVRCGLSDSGGHLGMVGGSLLIGC